jgi:co-chaperonin GroES (HSP10)
MENNSGLRALGRAILIKPYEPNIGGGLIVIPDSVKTGMATLEHRAIVIQVGPEAWKDEGSPRAKAGDRVFVAAFAGHMAVGTKDGIQYRFVNDRDIFAAIDYESGDTNE